ALLLLLCYAARRHLDSFPTRRSSDLWAKEIGLIAHKFIERISKLIQSGVHKKAFNEYLKGLQRDLNPSVDAAQAIEMLAQHIIRSEEHTSELQSRFDLVCRLLLEKKK